MNEIPILIRQACEDDHALIYNAWLKTVADAPFAYGIPKKIYYQMHANVVRTLLNIGHTLIACNPSDEDQIFGFINYHPDSNLNKLTLHFVFVKLAYRSFRVASTLKNTAIAEAKLEDPSIVSTHFTRDAHFLNEHWNIIYNPYLLWRICENFSD